MSADKLDRFTRLAAATQMTAALVDGMPGVPQAVAEYLADQSLPPSVVADLPDLSADRWQAAGIRSTVGPVDPDGSVFVSTCYAAVADTGAIVIRTGAGHSIANEFLAQTHIAVLPLSRLVQGLGDLWQLWRQEFPSAAALPRSFCMVTGPSRTADLGLPAKLGAQGPARVHVLIGSGI